MNDPIVDEIRKFRDAHAARFNYDLEAIYRDIKQREKEREETTGRRFVPPPLHPVEPPPTAAAARASANTALPESTPATEH